MGSSKVRSYSHSIVRPEELTRRQPCILRICLKNSSLIVISSEHLFEVQGLFHLSDLKIIPTEISLATVIQPVKNVLTEWPSPEHIFYEIYTLVNILPRVDPCQLVLITCWRHSTDLPESATGIYTLISQNTSIYGNHTLSAYTGTDQYIVIRYEPRITTKMFSYVQVANVTTPPILMSYSTMNNEYFDRDGISYSIQVSFGCQISLLCCQPVNFKMKCKKGYI